jgi:anti-anti-sigma factor
MSMPYLEISKRGNVITVRFCDCLILDQGTVDAIRGELYRLAHGDDIRRLVLDFSGVERLSSTMLSVVLMLKNGMVRKGGSLVLCCLSPGSRESLATSRLDQVLNIHDSLADALGAIDAFVHSDARLTNLPAG